MRGRAAGAALPVLVVVALVAVVAITATGSTPSGTDTTRRPSDVLLDTLFTLGLVTVAAGGILLIYGLSQRQAIAAEVAARRYPRLSLLGFLVVFGLITAIGAWGVSAWEVPELPTGEGDVAAPGEQVPPVPGDGEVAYEPSIAWVPIAVVVGLVAAGVAAYVLAERRRRLATSPDPQLAEQLALVLDDTLDDLRAEADPRRAVIAAYARLEQVLGAHGTPRLASETADEYLPRVLRSLDLDPAAVSRLTALFTRAKFSQHEVDAEMKSEAIAALVAVRDELRRLAGRADAGEAAAPAAVGAAS